MNFEYAMLDHGSDSNNPKRIVVHAMGEKIDDGNNIYSARDWLDYLGYSAHILVKPDGDMIRCRDDEQGAYHARGYNTDSLGIEFLVKGTHDYSTFLEALKTDWATPEQYKAGYHQIQYWFKHYLINPKDLNRHSDLSPGRKVDPGNFDMTKLTGEVA